MFTWFTFVVHCIAFLYCFTVFLFHHNTFSMRDVGLAKSSRVSCRNFNSGWTLDTLRI